MIEKVKVWFQNRRTKHKRVRSDDDEGNDEDDEDQEEEPDEDQEESENGEENEFDTVNDENENATSATNLDYKTNFNIQNDYIIESNKKKLKRSSDQEPCPQDFSKKRKSEHLHQDESYKKDTNFTLNNCNNLPLTSNLEFNHQPASFQQNQFNSNIKLSNHYNFQQLEQHQYQQQMIYENLMKKNAAVMAAAVAGLSNSNNFN